MKIKVKQEIMGAGKKMYEVAKMLKWHPSKLSRIINETYVPTEEEEVKLAKAIGVPVKNIF